MELFTGDISVIREDIDELREQICKCKNVAEIKNTIYTLYTLLDLYFCYTIDDNYNAKGLSKNKYYIKKSDEEACRLDNKFNNSFNKNKSFIKDISYKILERCTDEFDKIDDLISYEVYIKDNEKIDIMNSFLKTMDKDSDKLFIDLINEKRIFKYPDNDSYDAFTVLNNKNKKAIIAVSENYLDSTALMVSLMHEFGHIIDLFELRDNHSVQDYNILHSVSYYPEVISKFYEIEFIKYLINNNILKDDAKYNLELYYYSLYAYTENQFLLSCCSDKEIKTRRYMDIEACDLYDMIDKKYNVVKEGFADYYLNSANYYSTPLCGEAIHDAVIYPVGTVIANYLSYLKEKDNDKFDRVYRKFLPERVKMFNKNIFDILETDQDEIIDIMFKDIDKLKESKVYKKSNN